MWNCGYTEQCVLFELGYIAATERFIANNQLVGELPVRSVTTCVNTSLILPSHGVKELPWKDCLRVPKQILHYV